MMVAKGYKYTKNQWILYFKSVNCMVCEFYHNKAVIQNNKINPHNQNYSKRKGPSVPPVWPRLPSDSVCWLLGHPLHKWAVIAKVWVLYRLWGEHSSIQDPGSNSDKGLGDRNHYSFGKAYAISILYVKKHFLHTKKLTYIKIILGRHWAEEYPFCYLTLQSAVQCLHLGIHAPPCSPNMYVESDC